MSDTKNPKADDTPAEDAATTDAESTPDEESTAGPGSITDGKEPDPDLAQG